MYATINKETIILAKISAEQNAKIQKYKKNNNNNKKKTICKLFTLSFFSAKL